MTANSDSKAALLTQMGLEKTGGVRKGSVLVPLLALVVAALGFVLYGMEDGNEVLARGFKERCIVAQKLKLPDDPLRTVQPKFDLRKACQDLGVPDPATIGVIVDGFRSNGKSLKDRFDILWSFAGAEDTAAKGPESVSGTWRETIAFANAFLRELIGDLRAITVSISQTVGIAALCSLLPGLAGLIYRRNFLAWFVVPFAGILALVTNGWLPLPEGLTKMPESGATLVFFAMQALVLVLAYRLRRHSNELQAIGAGFVSAKTHNTVVFWLLVGLGVLCFMNQPAQLWERLGIQGAFYKGEFLALGLPLLYTLFRRSPLVINPDIDKNIVVCLDGTSNTPDQEERGLSSQTNVFKLFAMLKPDGDGGILPYGTFDASIAKRYGDKQLALYYTGVGNKFESSALGQLIGGATGLGASDIVERAYLDVMRVYKPGDRIFIFGFSRGAAIARLLANAISQRGAPRAVWTLRLFGRHWIIWKSRHRNKADARVPIAVLGCWDTVGAFGIAKRIGKIDFQSIDLFKDMSIPDIVEQAYHMVALDEQRQEFAPTLMDPDPIKPERIVEVWFPGDHANIGGGWGTPKLSDLTLDFLLRHVSSGYAHEAGQVPGNESFGLFLSAYDVRNVVPGGAGWPSGALAIDPDALGQVRQWHSAVYNYEPRRVPLHAVISETVFARMIESTPVYAPSALFKLNEALEEKRNTVARELERLSKTLSITEEECKSMLEFKEKLRLKRWPLYVESLAEERRPSGGFEPKLSHPGAALAHKGHVGPGLPAAWGPWRSWVPVPFLRAQALTEGVPNAAKSAAPVAPLVVSAMPMT